jgi:transposase
MSKVKQLDFSGKTIYCGLDVHKTNWKVNARMEGIEVAAFSQNPEAELLQRYFENHFPGSTLKVAYESGFCGFEIQRSLTALGIDCLIVNAADIPSTDKDRKRKTDKRDARKLSTQLSKGEIEGIYIPEREMEYARALLRQRHRLVKDQTRCVNRIKHLLLSKGVKTQQQSDRMSLKFVKVLRELDYGSEVLKMTIHYALDQYVQLRKIIKDITVDVKKLSRSEPFASVQSILTSIGGIGLINGMVIQTEICDMMRFKLLDSLCDYAGFVPDVHSSDEKVITKGITKRANEFLRAAIIESSWMLIRKDPAMLLKYQEYRKRMNLNKAIIRIGKHLLSRIRCLWNNNHQYVNGIMG